MKDFNLKQWLIENKSGMYSKTSINEALDADNAFTDGEENRGDMNEVNPAALGLGQAVADTEMEKQDDLNSDQVDNASMGVAAETVGWANIEKPADRGAVDSYLDVLNKHDMHYRQDDTYAQRVYDRGVQAERMLKQLYQSLSDNDKQKALDAYLEKAERFFPAAEYPSMAQRLRTLTTQNFEGA